MVRHSVIPLPVFLSDSICSVQIKVASVKYAPVMYSPWAMFEGVTTTLWLQRSCIEWLRSSLLWSRPKLWDATLSLYKWKNYQCLLN